MVGLGKMGGNMTLRLHNGGHKVVAFDLDQAKVAEVVPSAAGGASSLEDVVNKLAPPRVVWFMVPSGEPTDKAIAGVAEHMAPGDIIIDGGNSYYEDSMRHGEELAAKGIRFVDIGVSGGIWGLKEGYCLMAGGDAETFAHVEPILKTLAQPEGYALVGPVGAGHFVKMVHNGIEYAILESYAEGFELMHASRFSPDLHQIAALWMHGSVVRSWLLELMEHVFRDNPDLEGIKGYVEDSGEGRWTVHEALHLNIPVPAITNALFARYASREEDCFGAKIIAALRHEFGGHKVQPEPSRQSI